MFHDIPERVNARLRHLEGMDAADRQDGTLKANRLRQVSRHTGQFLALLAAAAPRGSILEIGTSGGYSTLWRYLAARTKGDNIITFEILPEKAALARQTFEIAGVASTVQVVEGDARTHLGEYRDVAFCFLDAEKDTYSDCYQQVLPLLLPGGFIVADNVISHEAELSPFIHFALDDEHVDAMVVPVGKGLLIARRRSADSGQASASPAAWPGNRK